MKKVLVLGEQKWVMETKAPKDGVRLSNKEILVQSSEQSSPFLLNQFLTELLYSELCKTYDIIRKTLGVEVLGSLDFEIVDRIDKRNQRIAKLKGNKIQIKRSVVALPRPVLEYVIAHEIAHISIKKHSVRFWKTVELMCPDFRKAQKVLDDYKDVLAGTGYIGSNV